MIELSGILSDATAAITPEYFRLRIDGGDPIYRERVYCYELYHQMRSRWPDGTPFYLNGEIDKSAHPILRKLGADYAKPDLLVHRPGYTTGNYAIIEVKSSKASVDGIRKDLETLSVFITRVKYQRAIYLIFGNEACTVAEKVHRTAKEFNDLPPIELWLHTQADTPAVHHSTLPIADGTPAP